MNKKFATRLEEFLSSELDDYSLYWDWEWDEGYEYCIVTVEDPCRNVKSESTFRYDEKNNQLLIQLGESNWHITEEFEPSVKYFWMDISPKLMS